MKSTNWDKKFKQELILIQSVFIITKFNTQVIMFFFSDDKYFLLKTILLNWIGLIDILDDKTFF